MLEADDTVAATRDLPAPRGLADEPALASAIEELGVMDAAAHRIVHGGTEFAAPVLIDASVRERLSPLSDLAPLHQPKSLAALDAVSRVLPGAPPAGCFDAAFHATLPPLTP